MDELRRRFQLRCAEREASLSQACHEANFEAIRSLAHDISGSAGLFGFAALSQEAQQLSETCRRGSDQEILEAARAMQASLVAVVRED